MLTHLAPHRTSLFKLILMNLKEIKQHPNFPFRNFCADDLEFLMLELYWAELFKSVLPQELVDVWSSELPADREGNPILFVVNRSAASPRILRVIVRFNDQHLTELNLDTFETIQFRDDAFVPFVPDLTRGALDEDMTTPVEELVISSSISDSCERLFREYVKLWCGEFLPVDKMLTRLNDYWHKINSSLVEI